MSGFLWAALGLLGTFFMAAIGDMASEEIRDRLDHLPHAILRLAARRLNPEQRTAFHKSEWVAELTYILKGDEARPVARIYHGTRFALGILVAARRITRNLHQATHREAKGSALRLEDLDLDAIQLPARRTVRHLLLGTHLRRLREAAGVTRVNVAAAISGSSADAPLMENKIARMEHGQDELDVSDIAKLLTLYEVDPGRERGWLLRIARELSVPGWWNAYSDSPSWVEPHLGFEPNASDIYQYAPQVVPEQLQTEDYACAVIRTGKVASEDEVFWRASGKMWYQHILKCGSPYGAVPKVWALLDESTLCRIVGSPEVMRAQLQHLIDMCDHPSVTLQILPFAAGAHRAMHGGVTILRFAEPELPDIAYIEQLAGVLYLDKPSEVEDYLEVIEEVFLQADPPARTKTILEAYLAAL